MKPTDIKSSPLRNKIRKLTEDIEKTERIIDENKKKLTELKNAKTEAENAEIISIVRNAELSADDIAELISGFVSETKPVPKEEKAESPSELKGMLK